MNSNSNISQIKKAIDSALEDSKNAPIAAFDADGTLWENDMGEDFFQYQVKNKLLEGLPAEPWDHYLRMHKEGPVNDAFLWLAQVNHGHPIDKVREWGRQFVKESDIPTFDFQKEIISHLLKNNVEVYVVTASAKWAVEPAAELYGIPNDNVIGFQTEIVDGLVTQKQKGASTWREGKVVGLLEQTDGKKPFYCSGNTMGDFALLECATALRLTVRTAPESNVNFQTEIDLLQHAKKENWFWFSKFSEDQF